MAWLVFAQVIIAVLAATPPSCTQRMPPAVPVPGGQERSVAGGAAAAGR